MPTLLEVQRSIGASLLGGTDGGAPAFIVGRGMRPEDRLAIYRNTSIEVMVTALRLGFVAVQHVVGAEFFEGAARMFIAQSAPRSAWLDSYGADFPAFLARLPQAACLPYVPDLARLEWGVNLALHAVGAMPLEVAALSGLNEAELAQLVLQAHPAAQLLRCEFPADAVWHAVLARDDDAMAAIDLSDGPVRLLVQRSTNGLEVIRLDERQWRIAAALFDGQPLGSVMAGVASCDGAHDALARLLARGCFRHIKFAHAPVADPTRGIHA